jgi:hypothetical protein
MRLPCSHQGQLASLISPAAPTNNESGPSLTRAFTCKPGAQQKAAYMVLRHPANLQRLLWASDARHYHGFVHEPPITIEAARSPVTEVAGLGVTTFIYMVARGDVRTDRQTCPLRCVALIGSCVH